MSVKNVLFLDDMAWRHDEFCRVAEHIEDVLVTRVYSAAAAMEALDGEPFDQVFLDHDLEPEATGMSVVNHILTMKRPPFQVVVHSCNGPAAARMVAKLETHPAGIWVRRVPFPELLNRIHTMITH